MKNVFRTIAELGINENYLKNVESHYDTMANMMYFRLIIVSLFLSIQDFLLYSSLQIEKLFLLDFIAFFIYLTLLLLNRKRFKTFSKFIFLIVINCQILFACIHYGPGTGFSLLYLLVGIEAFLILERKFKTLRYSFILISLLLFCGINIYFKRLNIEPVFDEQRLFQTNFLTVIFIFIVLLLIIGYFNKLNDQYYEDMNTERQRSEDLLRNILPSKIADRLKYSGKVIADNLQEASILFADIVGFTDSANQLRAELLVTRLNVFYSALDDLAAEFNLEKIKTIGDSYMAAAGIPEYSESHMLQICKFAESCLRASSNHSLIDNQPIQLRIGIASGPIVAGIIGKQKFAYDIWGDTVNLAYRLVSSSEPGRIHVSSNIAETLQNQFKFKKREKIDLKGFGIIQSYYLAIP